MDRSSPLHSPALSGSSESAATSSHSRMFDPPPPSIATGRRLDAMASSSGSSSSMQIPHFSRGGRRSRAASPTRFASWTSSGPGIIVKCPSLDSTNHSIPDCFVPRSHLNSSKPVIADLKSYLSETWPGKPAIDGMRFIHNGRLCSDDESIGQDDGNEVTLHLVIKAEAWRETARIAVPGFSASSTAIPAVPSVPKIDVQPPPVAEEGIAFGPTPPTTGRYRTIVTPVEDYCDLEYEQELVTRLQGWLQVDTNVSTLAEVQERLDKCKQKSALLRRLLETSYHLWTERYRRVLAELQDRPPPPIEEEVISTNPSTVAACDHFETRTLLMKPAPRKPVGTPTGETLRTRTITQMTEFTFPATPYYESRAWYLSDIISLRLSPMSLLLGEVRELGNMRREREQLQAMMTSIANQPAAAALQQPAEPARPFVETLKIWSSFMGSVVLAVLPTMFFLMFRVCILFWVFLKDLHGFKRTAMALLTAAYVFYHAYTAFLQEAERQNRAAGRHEHAFLGARIDWLFRGARAAAEAPAPAAAAAPTPNPATPADATTTEETDMAPADSPLVPSRFTATSWAEPRWWIEQLAFFGMEEEDMELGLRSAHRPHFHPRPRQLPPFEAIWRSVRTAVVLFFVTLIPEIEQIRRSAIVDREDLIRRIAREERERLDRIRQRQNNRLDDEGDTSEENGLRRRLNATGVAPAVPDTPAAVPATEGVNAVLQTPFAQRLLNPSANAAPPARPDV